AVLRLDVSVHFTVHHDVAAGDVGVDADGPCEGELAFEPHSAAEQQVGSGRSNVLFGDVLVRHGASLAGGQETSGRPAQPAHRLPYLRPKPGIPVVSGDGWRDCRFRPWRLTFERIGRGLAGPRAEDDVSDAPVQRQELTPIHFLERAGEVYATRLAVADGDVRLSWQQMRARARRLASALRRDGLRKGDRVAFLAVNSEPLLLAHFGVPLAGGVLVPINTRLNALAMALDHRLTADSQYLWTLPMFHCDGWCFPWATAAAGSCNVCIPRIEPERVWQLFREGITHFCAAPTVCTMLMASPAAGR